jgi:hypothetical protein
MNERASATFWGQANWRELLPGGPYDETTEDRRLRRLNIKWRRERWPRRAEADVARQDQGSCGRGFRGQSRVPRPLGLSPARSSLTSLPP